MGIGNGSKAERVVSLLEVADEVLGTGGSVDARRAAAMDAARRAGLEADVVSTWAGSPGLPLSAATRLAAFVAETQRRAREQYEAERRRQAEQLEAEHAARVASTPVGYEVDTREGMDAWMATQQRVQRSQHEWDGSVH